MNRNRLMVALVAAGLVGLCGQVAHAALAKAQGGSGYSGTLSSNKAVRKQQLICDPEVTGVAGPTVPAGAPVQGSTSITYDPAVVTLSNFAFGPGYTGIGYVEVQGEGGPFMMSLDDYFYFGGANTQIETGYAQVFYDTDPPVIKSEGPSVLGGFGTPGQIPVTPTFFTVDENGPPGFDTHEFTFDYLASVPDTTISAYKIFANPTTRPSGATPDTVTGENPDGSTFTLTAGQIAEANVRGSLIPLPAAVWMGGAMLAGLWGAGKARRRNLDA